MTGNFRPPAWIAFCLLLVSSIVCPADEFNRAESPAVDEIIREESLNQANADVLNARLKLAAWKLASLQALRESGFATWLEVARQQLLVDTLSKQRDALQEFACFTRALRQRASIALETQTGDAESLPKRTVSPMKISLPASVRLVGWIENGEGGLPWLAGHNDSVAATQELADKLQTATENLARAKARCSAFASNGSAAEHWKENAQWQLDLAQAEWQLARLQQDLLPGRRQYVTGTGHAPNLTFDNQLVSFRSPEAKTTARAGFGLLPLADIDHSITAASHRGLREATLKVARAEANATGELRAAEIELQRFELRLEALQVLQAEGFADRIEAELEAARQHVAEAALRVDQLRSQQEDLEQAYQSLMASPEEFESLVSVTLENSSSVAPSSNVIDSAIVETWPLSLLTDVEVVGHLIKLRRDSCETDAHRDALVLKLAMLERSLKRLESIAEDSANDSDLRQHAVGKNDLKSNLLRGLRGEIQALQLDIRHANALRVAAEERLEVLAGEEVRFMQQSLAQRNMLKHSRSTVAQFVGWNLADGVLPDQVALTGRDRDQPTRCSYLESRDFESRGSGLGLVFWQSSSRGCNFADYPSGIRLLDVHCGSTYRPSTPIGGDSSNSYLSVPSNASRLLAYPADNELRGTRINSPAQRDHLGSSYERAYPFGILRADLRSQQPVGFVPWYFPGSPANYPYPN